MIAHFCEVQIHGSSVDNLKSSLASIFAIVLLCIPKGYTRFIAVLDCTNNYCEMPCDWNYCLISIKWRSFFFSNLCKISTFNADFQGWMFLKILIDRRSTNWLNRFYPVWFMSKLIKYGAFRRDLSSNLSAFR